MKICSIENCETKHRAKGMCNRHYKMVYRIKNKEYIASKAATYWKQNKEHLKKYKAAYYQANKEKASAKSTERRKNDVQYRLSCSLRVRMSMALKRGQKSGSAVKDLGCSIPTFKLYIENQFVDGMSWDNYGEWHLDHVLPLSSFDLTNRGEFQAAVHYLNIQPLWAHDNLSKGGA